MKFLIIDQETKYQAEKTQEQYSEWKSLAAARTTSEIWIPIADWDKSLPIL